MTPDQQKQIEGARQRARQLDDKSPEWIEAELRREGWAEAAIRIVIGEIRGEVHVPCCNCGNLVDTREVEDGGDTHGAQFSDGDWVCSSECWEVAK